MWRVQVRVRVDTAFNVGVLSLSTSLPALRLSRVRSTLATSREHVVLVHASVDQLNFPSLFRLILRFTYVIYPR